ncbi:endoplasmin-like protein [Nicotiana attenuata]|uniref:Endoplasmin-like protein n=1 Tax=Nicotiana attenuata TaxID=49451 RepID=A0A1J6K5X5_NICAT|nr:endoplasmin-like protein [Nicotiana attenuata]OIT20448.1 endoplasmin-like protein [Nicotiana attenuata]OIT31903.1 endoplasmin-like protein [Nicotiana attenuata]
MSTMILGQEDIFYISDKEQLEKCYFLEMLKNKDYEVIVFKDEIDEHVIQHLGEYKGKKFHDVSEDESSMKTHSTSLLNGGKIFLPRTPLILTAYLERLLQSRTILDVGKQTYMLNKRVLKINPKHPIIKELRLRVAKDPKDDSAKEIAKIMYGIALLENGLELNDLDIAASHPYNLVQRFLKSCPTIIKEEVEPKAEIEGGRVRDIFEKCFLCLGRIHIQAQLQTKGQRVKVGKLEYAIGDQEVLVGAFLLTGFWLLIIDEYLASTQAEIFQKQFSILDDRSKSQSITKALLVSGSATYQKIKGGWMDTSTG